MSRFNFYPLVLGRISSPSAKSHSLCRYPTPIQWPSSCLFWPRVRDVFPKLQKRKRRSHPFTRISAAKLNRLAAICMSGRLEIVNRAVNSPIEFQCEQKNMVTEYLEHNQLSYASSCATVHKKLPRFTYIFNHSVFCLTTGPKPPLKRFLHIVRSRASSFK